MPGGEDSLLLSGLQHFAFCRRQWALIHVEQLWEENLLTTQGMLMHERAHDGPDETRGDLLTVRGLAIRSGELGIHGVCDVVEFHRDEAQGVPLHGRTGRFRVVPVEYKRGRPKEHSADALQLCAQALCLEEMLVCDIPLGYLYYGETRRRTEVLFDQALRDEVRKMVAEMRDCFRRGHTPRVKYSKACGACSLAEVCVPSIRKNTSAKDYMQAAFEEETP